MSTGAEMARYESYDVRKYATISAKKRKYGHETSWWKAEVYSFYLVSLSFNTEVELLMKKRNQSTTTVSILIVQLRFKKKNKKKNTLPLHYLAPLGVVV